VSVLSRRGFLRGGFFGVVPASAAEPSAPPASGLARILPTACLAFRGTECRACVDRCPVPGAVTLERGRPRVEPTLCDGCGLCVDSCPAPRGAIVRVAAGHAATAPTR